MEPRQQDLFARDLPPWEMDLHAQCSAAKIVFAEPPHGPFHYRVPTHLAESLQPGMRVLVPLGRGNREVPGYCIGLEVIQQNPDSLKPILRLIDTEPLCTPQLLKLIQWMSDYYLVSLGTVFEAVVPSGVREGAGTREQISLTVAADFQSAESISKLTKKQQELIQKLSSVGEPLTVEQLRKLGNCSAEFINRLRKMGVLATTKTRVMQHTSKQAAMALELPPALSIDQRQVLQKVRESIDSRNPSTILLHGITGSGKTEVYIQAIEHVIACGLQAIVLVPEISLTPQTRGRFQQRFKSVSVLHSQMSGPERHYQWRKIMSGGADVVIGPRSAVFAPVPRLGLIILDEEHDSSFKQDTLPRYHARDVAIQRAALSGLTIILGSATPSLETWQACISGASQRVSLPRRIHNRPLPGVEIVDMRLSQNQARGAISRPLYAAVRETLQSDGQMILLLNRRGFATSIQCPKCGHVESCPHCDLPLTHHEEGRKAICHYCDHEIPTPNKCLQCGASDIQLQGIGTQKLEQEVKAKFPDATVARMDSDTMRKPGSHERTLAKFRTGETKILLGTQMIAKGLDFPNVLLVGVINADTALHFPDFRAAERTFQLVTQVAGRTGRGERAGRVLVQTYSAEHPSIMAASKHDYLGFAKAELEHRARLGYPPFGSLARIIVRGPERELTEAYAEQIGRLIEEIQARIGTECRILGPAPPPIEKLRGKYRFHLLLRAAEPESLNRLLKQMIAEVKPAEEMQWIVDIDPIDML